MGNRRIYGEKYARNEYTAYKNTVWYESHIRIALALTPATNESQRASNIESNNWHSRSEQKKKSQPLTTMQRQRESEEREKKRIKY